MPIYDPIAKALGVSPIVLPKIDSSMYEETSSVHPFQGKKHSEETKAILVLKSSKNRHSEETKQKIAKSNTGKVFSKERKESISKAKRGKKINQARGVFSGTKNPRYDHTIYHFSHNVHGKITCTKFELCNQFQLNNSNLNAMIKGRYRHTKGWTLCD